MDRAKHCQPSYRANDNRQGPSEMNKNGLNPDFEYITKTLINQELELQVRSSMAKIKTRLKSQQILQSGRIETAHHAFSDEFLDTKLCDILPVIGNPKSTKEFVKHLQLYGDGNEDSRDNASPKRDDIGLPPKFKTPHGGSKQRLLLPNSSSSNTRFVFPEPSQTSKVTPANGKGPVSGFTTPVFTFGQSQNGLSSTAKKAPRPPKPGETLYTYSATGSPVIQSCSEVRTNNACPTARIKVDDGMGRLIDVDLVYRGGGNDGKEFGKMVTDLRGIIATRSAQNSRKVLPPRVLVKKRKSVANPLRNKSSSSTYSHVL